MELDNNIIDYLEDMSAKTANNIDDLCYIFHISVIMLIISTTVNLFYEGMIFITFLVLTIMILSIFRMTYELNEINSCLHLMRMNNDDPDQIRT